LKERNSYAYRGKYSSGYVDKSCSLRKPGVLEIAKMFTVS